MIAVGICEKGNVRKENQDAILVRCAKRSGLFIVADGVGGSRHGGDASSHLVINFNRWWDECFMSRTESAFIDLFDRLKELTEKLNGDLYRWYGQGGACSTLALLFVHKGRCGYLSAGDSRIYRCNRKGSRLINRDDVWENRADTPETASNQGKLLSAVGGREQLDYSCATDRLLLRESFFLCSDGIYKFVDQDKLYRQLKGVRRRFNLEESALNVMVQTALDNGTTDNYSLIAVKIGI